MIKILINKIKLYLTDCLFRFPLPLEHIYPVAALTIFFSSEMTFSCSLLF